jgi:hypothetical protein
MGDGLVTKNAYRITLLIARGCGKLVLPPRERNPMETFESKVYQWQGKRIIRTTDTVAEREHFADGSFLPQRIVATKVSEVKPTDSDYEDAVEFANELMREEYLAQFE